MRRPRVILADDHVLLMDAFRKLLEPEFEVVGTVTDGKSLISMATHLRPDLIVLDLGIPLLNGMDAGRKLKMLLPKTRLLVVTMNEDIGVAVKALREWASGFLLKKCAGTELVFAIRELMVGNSPAGYMATSFQARSRMASDHSMRPSAALTGDR